MATVTPNFNWPVPTSTDLVKDGATAIEALGDAIDTSMVDLKGGTTGQILSKASSADMDFSWTTPNPGDITGVTAGTGISGGGTSGDVTITNSMATAIDAKGDLIAGTAADTFSRLAVGTNGQVLTADSTASTGLAWATPTVSSTFYAGKNKVINGDFGIWQRGTSFSLSSGVVTYTSDRWRSVMPSGTTISRQTFTPGTAPVAGYEGQYYFNALITANAQNYEHGQFIESARTFAGQTVTLSFWARSTVGAQPMNVTMYQNFGTGGSPSSQVEITASTGTTPFTPTSSWVRYVYTFNVPSVSGKTFGTNNDSYLWIRIGQYTTTATNTSIDYWGVQLEAGSSATDFVTASGGSYQAELAMCQRYYFQTFVSSASESANKVSTYSDSNYAQGTRWPVQMRVAPSVTVWSSNGPTSNRVRQISNNTNYTPAALIDIGVNGFNVFTGIALSNMIDWHYQASAEL